MIPELRKIQDEIRAILFSSVESIGSTRGALYLPVSHDRTDRRFKVVAASHQFKIGSRATLTARDPLVDLLTVRRSPLFVNGVGADLRLAEILFSQGSDRLLAAPLFTRGRLIGFFDFRDKARGEAFNQADLEAVQRLTTRMLALLGRHNLFDAAPISLASADHGQPISAPERPTRHDAAAPKRPPLSDRARRVIESARHLMSRHQHAVLDRSRVPAETEFDVIDAFLPAVLAIPGAVIAAATSTEHSPRQSIASSLRVTSQVAAELRKHLAQWLRQFDRALPDVTPHIHVSGAGAVEARPIACMMTAPVCLGSFGGLVLTAGFTEAPSSVALTQLARFRDRLEQAIDDAGMRAQLADRQRLIAEMLLQPDFQAYSNLADHSRDVATLGYAFAEALGLSDGERQVVGLGALLHDVGLRLLDYEHLYELPQLTEEQRLAMQEHPTVGAALVRPLLGPEVAEIVLRHHERVDGTGYPSRLAGAQIPRGARIVGIVDAWVSMTSRTYSEPISRNAAVERLREGAGTQFDAMLVDRFIAAGLHRSEFVAEALGTVSV